MSMAFQGHKIFQQKSLVVDFFDNNTLIDKLVSVEFLFHSSPKRWASTVLSQVVTYCDWDCSLIFLFLTVPLIIIEINAQNWVKFVIDNSYLYKFTAALFDSLTKQVPALAIFVCKWTHNSKKIILGEATMLNDININWTLRGRAVELTKLFV